MSLISVPYDVAVVEPHVDDAFLSLGQHIENWVKEGRRVAIVSVYSAGIRGDEAKAYARAVGATSVLLDYEQTVRGAPLPSDIFHDSEAGISIEAGWWIGPLAITHPDHIVVRTKMPRGCSYYLDMPYSIVQRNGPQVTELCEGRQILSYLKPPSRKYRHVPIFHSQSKYFHYNPVEKLIQTFEMIVSPILK